MKSLAVVVPALLILVSLFAFVPFSYEVEENVTSLEAYNVSEPTVITVLKNHSKPVTEEYEIQQVDTKYETVCEDKIVSTHVRFGPQYTYCHTGTNMDDRETKCSQEDWDGNCIKYNDYMAGGICEGYAMHCNLITKNNNPNQGGNYEVNLYYNDPDGSKYFIRNYKGFLYAGSYFSITGAYNLRPEAFGYCSYEFVKSPTYTECRDVPKDVIKTQTSTVTYYETIQIEDKQISFKNVTKYRNVTELVKVKKKASLFAQWFII